MHYRAPKISQVQNNSAMQCRITYVTRYVILLLLWYLSNIMKHAIKTGNITQVILLTNVMRYLSNIVTVMNLILCNIITTSNVVTNLVSNPLSNAKPQ